MQRRGQLAPLEPSIAGGSGRTFGGLFPESPGASPAQRRGQVAPPERSEVYSVSSPTATYVGDELVEIHVRVPAPLMQAKRDAGVLQGNCDMNTVEGCALGYLPCDGTTLTEPHLESSKYIGLLLYAVVEGDATEAKVGQWELPAEVPPLSLNLHPTPDMHKLKGMLLSSGQGDSTMSVTSGLRHCLSTDDIASPYQLVKFLQLRVQNSTRGVPPDALGGHAFHTYSLRGAGGTVEFQFRHNVCGRRVYAEGTAGAPASPRRACPVATPSSRLLRFAAFHERRARWSVGGAPAAGAARRRTQGICAMDPCSRSQAVPLPPLLQERRSQERSRRAVRRESEEVVHPGRVPLRAERRVLPQPGLARLSIV